MRPTCGDIVLATEVRLMSSPGDSDLSLNQKISGSDVVSKPAVKALKTACTKLQETLSSV